MTGMVSRIWWALMAAAVLVQVFVPPFVGLADNADFGKVTGVFGMGAPLELQRRFVAPVYTVEERYAWWDSPFRSSERVLAGIAVGVAKVLSPDGAMDIRVMGAVHAALLLTVFWVLLPELGRVGAVAAAIFADVLHASHRNTFHMDVAALLGLLAMVGFYLRASRTRRWVDWTGFLAGSAMLVLSKTAHAPLGVVLAMVALAFRRYVVAGAWLAGAGWMFAGTPAEYPPMAAYNVVFFRMLPDSRSPEANLAELGMDPALKRYSGTFVYEPRSGLHGPRHARQSLPAGAVLFAPPADRLAPMEIAMNEGSRLRHLVGNSTPGSGRAEYEESRSFTQWSGPKRRVFEGRASLLTVVAAILCALSAAQAIRAPGLAPLYLAPPAMGAAELLIAGLADTLEVARHMSLFHAIFDLLVVLPPWAV